MGHLLFSCTGQTGAPFKPDFLWFDKIGICNPTKQICRDVHLFIPQILTVCQFPMRTMDKVPSDLTTGAACALDDRVSEPLTPVFLPFCLQGVLRAPPTRCLILFHFPSQREELMAEPKSGVLLLCITTWFYTRISWSWGLVLPALQVAEDDYNK